MFFLKRQKGFNLIEMVIAILIFTTCCLGMFGILYTSLQASKQGEEILAANHLIEKEM